MATPNQLRSAGKRLRLEAEWRRAAPPRELLILREAIERSGLKILGFIHDVTPDDLLPLYFDYAVQLPGDIGYIKSVKGVDLITKYNLRALTRRREWILANNALYLELRVESTMKTQAKIEMWLLGLKSRRQIIIPPANGKKQHTQWTAAKY